MRNTQDKIKKTIMSSIRNNQAIKNPSHVSIEIKSTSAFLWKKNEIHLCGRVDLAIEKAEIEKIVQAEARGKKIVNTLKIDKKY